MTWLSSRISLCSTAGCRQGCPEGLKASILPSLILAMAAWCWHPLLGVVKAALPLVGKGSEEAGMLQRGFVLKSCPLAR